MTAQERIQLLREKGLSDDQIKDLVARELTKRAESKLIPWDVVSQTMFGLKSSGLLKDIGMAVGDFAKESATDPAFVSGTTGAAYGGMVGGPVGAAVGAGVGAMAGKAYDMGVETTQGKPHTQGEIWKESAKEGLLFATAERVGQGVVRAGQAVKGFLKKTPDPGSLKVEPAFEQAGGQFSAAQRAPQSAGLGAMKGIADVGYFGRGTMERFKQMQTEALETLSESTAVELSEGVRRNMSPFQRGKLLIQTLEGGAEAHHAAAKQMYAALDAKTEGKKVSMQAVADAAHEHVKALTRRKDIGKTDRGGVLLDRLKAFRHDTPGQPAIYEKLSFADAHALRSDLKADARALKGNPDEAKAYAVVTEMIKHIDMAMGEAAFKAGPEVYKAWRKTDQFYRVGKRRFDDGFVAKLLSDRTTAESVGDMLYKAGRQTELLRVQQALKFAKKVDPNLDTEKAWGAIKEGWFKNLVEKHSKSGNLNPESFYRELNDPKMKRSLSVLMPEDQLKAVRDFALTAHRVGAKVSAEGQGSVAVQLTQNNALIMAASGTLAGAAVWQYKEGDKGEAGALGSASMAILVAPWAFSKLLTNPKTAKWLTSGIQMSAKSPLAGGLVGRIATEAAKLQMPEGETTPAVRAVPREELASGAYLPNRSTPRLTQEKGY